MQKRSPCMKIFFSGELIPMNAYKDNKSAAATRVAYRGLKTAVKSSSLPLFPAVLASCVHVAKAGITSVDSCVTHPSKPELLFFGGPSGDVIAVSSKYANREVLIAKHAGLVSCVSVSPDGMKIATAGSDRMMVISFLHSNARPIMTHPHLRCMRSIQWAKDSRHLISAGDDKVVKMCSLSEGSVTFKATLVGHTNWVRFAAFDLDLEPSQAVSCGDDFSVRLWDIESRKSITTFTDHSNSVLEAHFMPSSPWCSSGIASGGLDKSVNIWDSRDRCLVQHYGSHNGPVKSLAFHSSGLYLASGCADGVLRMWDLRGGKLLWKIEAHSGSLNCVRIIENENCSRILTGGDDRRIGVYRSVSQVICSSSNDVHTFHHSRMRELFT